jgi:hypothetical protein
LGGIGCKELDGSETSSTEGGVSWSLKFEISLNFEFWSLEF